MERERERDSFHGQISSNALGSPAYLILVKRNGKRASLDEKAYTLLSLVAGFGEMDLPLGKDERLKMRFNAG